MFPSSLYGPVKMSSPVIELVCLLLLVLIGPSTSLFSPSWNKVRSQALSSLIAPLSSINPGENRVFDLRSFRLFASDKFEIEDTESYYDELPKLEDNLLHQVDVLLDKLLSSSTLNTVSYYMIEFKNDIEYQWIMKFENCKEDRFERVKFHDYITKMIKMDKHEIEILMDPPKNYLKNIDLKRKSQARLSYGHTIEPRKIANQIISVREDVCNEILVDLNSIKLEHEEAIRYAKACLQDGRELAEKNRRATRYSSQGSTPYRDKTFYECSLLLTNIALDVFRGRFNLSSNHLGLKLIEDTVKEAGQEEADYLESQGLTNIPGARSPNFILGDIYYKGLSQGLIEDGDTTLNTMTLAKEFLATRLALALAMSNSITNHIRLCRNHFATIKEYGGFARLDFSSPKIKVVYLDDLAAADAEKLKEAKAAETNKADTDIEKNKAKALTSAVGADKPLTAASKKEGLVSASATIAAPSIAADKSVGSESKKVSKEEVVDLNLTDWDSFSGFGPMSM